MKNSALGLIETYGYVGAVEAADAALKAADVSLVDLVKVRGGIMTLTLMGEVAAVKASVDAGAASAERLGVLLTSHVIARLDEEVWSIVEPEGDDPEDDPDPSDEKEKEMEEEESEETEPLTGKEAEEQSPDEPSPQLGNEEPTEMEKNLPKEEGFSRETLKNLKVVELRRIARKLDGINIPKNQIKFANKAELMREISEAQERRSKA
ncbi:BMC domain-containing protein [Proteiniclasticum sp. SCR006]|uniref:BMC domain-containing protein n=1 Tax=Proteiniclasticum aestuarii TaxID=2817862 RepID=A0A939KG62_9CLOT|nr:BMC domain-containing protein [Proteiniclasticum aestuarii]MBO1265167.1 BMC domain-containing protein [Proteiniclasticum aestuarii]